MKTSPLLAIFAACLALAGCESIVSGMNAAQTPEWALRELPQLGMAYPKEKALAANPQWSERAQAAVRAGRVFIGMSRVQVLASMGPPMHRNVTTTENHRREQWVYYYAGTSRRDYVYIGNAGTVEAIQN